MARGAIKLVKAKKIWQKGGRDVILITMQGFPDPPRRSAGALGGVARLSCALAALQAEGDTEPNVKLRSLNYAARRLAAL